MKPIINSGKILINTKENIFYALQNIYGLSSYKSINICKQHLVGLEPTPKGLEDLCSSKLSYKCLKYFYYLLITKIFIIYI